MALEIPPTVPNPLPPWARPSHTLHTPRLLLRSALESDAPAFTKLFSDPKNNPFGGVRGHFRTEEEQRENLSKQADSTARGENAWLVVILKPGLPVPEGAEILKTHNGLLIGSTGFNEFKLETDEEKAVLRTDVGCLIDWRFHRKGYALETLEAVIQYGFSELRAEKISADTNLENTPWRKLMDIMVS
jgi:RimJ/RimL family protein N-acetyltransferase